MSWLNDEQGVPFIFATGYAEGKDALRQRFDVPILSKPFTGAQLAEQVKLVMSEAQS